MADDTATPTTPPPDPYPIAPTGHIGSAKFTTPEQAKANRLMALQLMGRGKEGAQQDVHHWTQGLSNMANDLVGGLLMRKALAGENEQLERSADSLDPSRAYEPNGGIPAPQSGNGISGLFSGVTGGIKRLFGGGEDGGSTRTASMPVPTGEAANDAAYIRQAAAARGINPDVAVKVAASEGLFDYVGDQGSSFGPFQLHYGGMAPGGNAVGGLGDEFTKATGLHARDPHTKKAQIDFALNHASQNGWGPWHGWKGPQFAGIGAQSRPVGQSKASAADVAAASPRPASGASPIDTQGNEAVSQSGGVPPTKVASTNPTAGVGPLDRNLAAAQALAANHPGGGGAVVGDPGAGRVQVAASRAAPGGASGMATGGSVPPNGQIPENLRPRVLPVSPQQLHEAIRNPYVPWEYKMQLLERYRQQFQPRQAVDEVGNPVMLPPEGQSGPGMTIRKPQILKQKIEGAGEFDVPTQFGPGNTANPMGVGGGGPGGVPGISGPAAPAPAKRSVLDGVSDEPPPPEPEETGGNAAPAKPDAFGPLTQAPPSGKGVQVASLDPSIGVGGPPPETKPVEKGAQVAEASAPGFLPSWVPGAVDWGRENKIKTQAGIEGAKKAAESAQEYYDTVTNRAQSAADTEKGELNQLERTVGSKDFYSGFGSGAVLAYKRALAATGMGDKEAAGAMETFEKLRQDLNLSLLKTKLGGLGQIRLAEINMINHAFANLDNSVAANKALIYMAKVINSRTTEAGKLANEYREAHGGVPDLSLKNRLFNYYKDKPLMTDKQIGEYEKLITTQTKEEPKSIINTPASGKSEAEQLREERQKAKQKPAQPKPAEIPL